MGARDAVKRAAKRIDAEIVATVLVVVTAAAVSIGLGHASAYVGAPEPWPLLVAMAMAVASAFGLSKLADVWLARRKAKAGER